MRVAVTGATGFVGGDIAHRLAARGHTVIELIRHPAGGPDAVERRRYELAEPIVPTILDGVEAVVHCAFVRAGRDHEHALRTNVNGTRQLFELARARGVPFLFLSSVSASPEAQSVYGRQKHALEQALAPRGACVVRPGLVVGNGGLVRNLVDTMRRRHILPLVDGGRQPVQCIWRTDVSDVVSTLVERGCPGGLLTIAAEPVLTVGRLARSLRDLLGIRAPSVHLPFALAYSIAAGLEFAGVAPPVTTENLLGLRAANVAACDDLRPMGITPLTWPEQLTRLRAEFAP